VTGILDILPLANQTLPRQSTWPGNCEFWGGNCLIAAFPTSPPPPLPVPIRSSTELG
jgi:hypothetical protein